MRRRLPVLGQEVRRYQADRKRYAERHQNEIAEIAGDRNEIQDEIDRLIALAPSLSSAQALIAYSLKRKKGGRVAALFITERAISSTGRRP
jgi:hypothetical protein